VLVAYGKAVLARPPVPEGQLYDLKYKGIWICLCMLSRAMSGNYVNFGVFDLYGDRWAASVHVHAAACMRRPHGRCGQRSMHIRCWQCLGPVLLDMP
jgi:hypothetical protein